MSPHHLIRNIIVTNIVLFGFHSLITQVKDSYFYRCGYIGVPQFLIDVKASAGALTQYVALAIDVFHIRGSDDEASSDLCKTCALQCAVCLPRDIMGTDPCSSVIQFVNIRLDSYIGMRVVLLCFAIWLEPLLHLNIPTIITTVSNKLF